MKPGRRMRVMVKQPRMTEAQAKMPKVPDFTLAFRTDKNFSLDGDASMLKYCRDTKRREWYFPFGSFDSWLAYLENLRDKIQRSVVDDGEKFEKWRHALKRNINAFRSAISERNFSTSMLLQDTFKNEPDCLAFRSWVVSQFPPDMRQYVSRQFLVDVAHFACHGLTGYADAITHDEGYFGYLEELGRLRNNLQVGAPDEARHGAEILDGFCQTVLDTMLSYERIPVYTIKRAFRPFSLQPKDAEQLRWIWED